MKIREKVKEKINNIDEETFIKILMGGLLVGGICVGVIYGKDLGYTKGLKEFRKTHIDIAKNLINECGQQAAFLALDYVRSTPGAIETLLEHPDVVMDKACEAYYKSGYVTTVLASLER